MTAHRIATSSPSQTTSPGASHVTCSRGSTFAPPPPTPFSLASHDTRSPSPFAFSSATSDVSTAASTAATSKHPGRAETHTAASARVLCSCLPPKLLSIEEDGGLAVFGEPDFDGDMSDWKSDVDSDSSDNDDVSYASKGTTFPMTDYQAQLIAAQRAIDIARSHIATPIRAFAQSHAATPVAIKLALEDLNAPIAEAQQAIAAAQWRTAAAVAVMGA